MILTLKLCIFNASDGQYKRLLSLETKIRPLSDTTHLVQFKKKDLIKNL